MDTYRYSQSQLYSLVSDVPSYSSFIPFCTSSRVLQGIGKDDNKRGTKDWKPDDQPFDLDAELTVGFGGLEERYTSRVMGRPFESVTASHLRICCLDRAVRILTLTGHCRSAIHLIQIAQNDL